ncbi:TPA: hypothetical protein ACJRT5_001540 [Streptococcus agalactiae]
MNRGPKSQSNEVKNSKQSEVKKGKNMIKRTVSLPKEHEQEIMVNYLNVSFDRVEYTMVFLMRCRVD